MKRHLVLIRVLDTLKDTLKRNNARLLELSQELCLTLLCIPNPLNNNETVTPVLKDAVEPNRQVCMKDLKKKPKTQTLQGTKCLCDYH